MHYKKKKKDFKLSEQIVAEFERLAPSGKQTAIVEQLISDWVKERKREACAEKVKSAYLRESKRR